VYFDWSKNMYELLYSSVSPAGLSQLQLKDILDNARLKNLRLDITGMLLYHNREIMQILEGEEQTVKELYATICQDDRHTNLQVLYQGVVKQRSFSEWSMAFKMLDQTSAQQIVAGFEAFDDEVMPQNVISSSQNRGKKTFLLLRETL
jgi:hypothetical protein